MHHWHYRLNLEQKIPYLFFHHLDKVTFLMLKLRLSQQIEYPKSLSFHSLWQKARKKKPAIKQAFRLQVI